MASFQATVVDIVGEGPAVEVLVKIPSEAAVDLGPPGTVLAGVSVAGPNGVTVVFISAPPPAPPP